MGGFLSNAVLFFFIIIIYLKGTVHFNEQVHANMPELTREYFHSAAPGRSEKIAQYNDKYIHMKKCKK